MKKRKILWKYRRREITLILVSTMVLTLFFSGYSMGKEYRNIKVDTYAKVAEPIMVVENGQVLEIDGNKPKEYYQFKVKNYKENGEVTQINLVYSIEILSKEDPAISFKLYKDNQEIPLEENKTANSSLEKGIAQEDCYQLEIIYDETKNTSLREILQDVQIKVHSEQMRT